MFSAAQPDLRLITKHAATAFKFSKKRDEGENNRVKAVLSSCQRLPRSCSTKHFQSDIAGVFLSIEINDLSDTKPGNPDNDMTIEEQRLQDLREGSMPWRMWGPYLSERQWGTVREDYSEDGNAWEYFPHDHARSRAYRWGEDGLAGICDEKVRLCFALALWNGNDPILKERLFGLTNSEGNHGEDVKEYYFYLDNTT